MGKTTHGTEFGMRSADWGINSIAECGLLNAEWKIKNEKPPIAGAPHSELNVAFLDGVSDEVCGFLQLQLLHHVGTMTLNGTDADKEKIANVLTRFSLCDQL